MTIDRWLEHWADHRPDATAIEFVDQSVTYRSLYDRVCRVAGGLRAHGVESGDRVAYLGGDGPTPLEILFACARIGAIHLPLNTRLAAPELSWIVGHAEPSLVLADAEYATAAADMLADHPATRRAVVGASDNTEQFEVGNPTERCGDDRDPVLMCYTSGTTGRPKGAVLDQLALMANAANVAAMMDVRSTDRVLNTMPLFHVGGLNVHTTPTLAAGGTIVLHRRFDPAAVLAELAGGRIDLVTLLAPMLVAVTELGEFGHADLSGVRAVNTGASPVPIALIEAIHAKGVPVTQIYGLTETATLCVCLRAEHARVRVGSCGKAALTSEVRLVDESGADVTPGEAGEIVVRGPNVMREYWRDPEGTASAFVDGWFRTGDVAVTDPDGFMYIRGRRKDLIISGGENIYPAELEDLLVDVPGVAEAVVVARPDHRWGEVPVVVAVRAADADVTDEALIAAFEGRVARYKVPKAVIWIDALPRTAMGKVRKHVLRDVIDELT
jgi:fatty-acyl-CoA synthase